MSHNFTSDIKNDLTTEASAWLAQLESESMKSDDLAAFKEWVERSPAHKREIRRLASLSNDLNILAEMAGPLREAANKQRQIGNIRSKIKWPKLNALASFGLVVTFMVLGNFFINTLEQVNSPILYTTNVGVHREIELNDGTVIGLNTDSKIEIDYSPMRRKVRLLKGEAFFQVAHNPDRPFIVYAGEKSVKAIGTAFIVSLLPKAFEVTVTEGKVELSNTANITNNPTLDALGIHQSIQRPAISEAPAMPIFLSAGETVTYDPDESSKVLTDVIETVSEREMQRRLSWKDGLLDFSETPLIDVIDDLSRYTDMKIEISDPALRNLKFGGLFRTDELQALFSALETTFAIKIEKINEKHVRLSLIGSEQI